MKKDDKFELWPKTEFPHGIRGMAMNMSYLMEMMHKDRQEPQDLVDYINHVSAKHGDRISGWILGSAVLDALKRHYMEEHCGVADPQAKCSIHGAPFIEDKSNPYRIEVVL